MAILGEAAIVFREKGLASVKRAARGATSALRSTVNPARMLQAGLTALAGAGLGAMVKQSMNSIDALAKTSDKLGITTEKLAGLRHAAELTGAGQTALDKGLQRMTTRIGQAAQATGVAQAALRELGLSAQELNQMSPDEQFRRIADAMGAIAGQNDRVRLGFKLFGGEYSSLLNTLDLGTEGLDRMQTEAEQLGLAISRTDAAKIEEAKDAATRAQTAFRGVTTELTIALAPAIETAANELVSLVQAGRDWGSGIADDIGFVVGNWELYATIVSEQIGLAMDNGWERTKTFFQNIAELLAWLLENWQSVFETIQNATGTAFTNAAENAKRAWRAVMDGEDFEPVGLLDGFENAIKELPKLTEAEVRRTTPELDRAMERLGESHKAFMEDVARAEGSGTTPAGAGGAAGTARGGAVAQAARRSQSMAFDQLASMMQQSALNDPQVKAQEEGNKIMGGVKQAAEKMVDALTNKGIKVQQPVAVAG